MVGFTLLHAFFCSKVIKAFQIFFVFAKSGIHCYHAEVESSRTSLASRTNFEVLGLSLEAQVLENCPVLGSRTALFFEQLKFGWKTPEISRKICEYLFCFRLLEHRRSQWGRHSQWRNAFFVFVNRSIGVANAQRGRPPIEISPMTKM